MGKTNRKRVFLGGLVAGVALNILFYVNLPAFGVTSMIGLPGLFSGLSQECWQFGYILQFGLGMAQAPKQL